MAPRFFFFFFFFWQQSDNPYVYQVPGIRYCCTIHMKGHDLTCGCIDPTVFTLGFELRWRYGRPNSRFRTPTFCCHWSCDRARRGRWFVSRDFDLGHGLAPVLAAYWCDKRQSRRTSHHQRTSKYVGTPCFAFAAAVPLYMSQYVSSPPLVVELQ